MFSLWTILNQFSTVSRPASENKDNAFWQSCQQSWKEERQSLTRMNLLSLSSERTKETQRRCQLCTLGRWLTAAKWTDVVSMSRSLTVSLTTTSTCVEWTVSINPWPTTLLCARLWNGTGRSFGNFLTSVVNTCLLYTKLGGTKHQIWFHKQLIRSLVVADDHP